MVSESKVQQFSPGLAFKLVLSQLFVTIFLAAGLYFFFGRTAAWSALAGGLIATVANAWFALKVFKLGRIDDPVRVLRSFYWGEINKILITGALFITAFVMIRPVNGAALIAVYFVVHMTPFVVSMFFKNTH